MTYTISKQYYPLAANEEGKIINSISGKEISQFLHHTGYYYVTRPAPSTQRTVGAHRVVADALVENTNPSVNVVNHIDGDKTNNRASNLEWCTHSYNVKHAYDIGLAKPRTQKKGEDHASAIRTNEEVHRICKALSDGARITDVAKEFGLHVNYVGAIRSGKCWGHISSQYTFPKGKRDTLSESTVRWICREIVDGTRIVDIVKKSRNPSVTKNDVKNIKYGKTFSHISKEYF